MSTEVPCNVAVGFWGTLVQALEETPEQRSGSLKCIMIFSILEALGQMCHLNVQRGGQLPAGSGVIVPGDGW